MLFHVDPYTSAETKRPYVRMDCAGKCYWLTPGEARQLAVVLLKTATQSEEKSPQSSPQLTLPIVGTNTGTERKRNGNA